MNKILTILMFFLAYCACKNNSNNTAFDKQAQDNSEICKSCFGTCLISTPSTTTVMEWNGSGYSPVVRYETKYIPCVACGMSGKIQKIKKDTKDR